MNAGRKISRYALWMLLLNGACFGTLAAHPGHEHHLLGVFHGVPQMLFVVAVALVGIVATRKWWRRSS